MARLDNLGKGASGAAVQSMNVHLGSAPAWSASPAHTASPAPAARWW
jgi:N-acetyl-gamma-glutamylphosphate reductase